MRNKKQSEEDPVEAFPTTTIIFLKKYKNKSLRISSMAGIVRVKSRVTPHKTRMAGINKAVHVYTGGMIKIGMIKIFGWHIKLWQK